MNFPNLMNRKYNNLPLFERTGDNNNPFEWAFINATDITKSEYDNVVGWICGESCAKRWGYGYNAGFKTACEFMLMLWGA